MTIKGRGRRWRLKDVGEGGRDKGVFSKGGGRKSVRVEGRGAHAKGGKPGDDTYTKHVPFFPFIYILCVLYLSPRVPLHCLMIDSGCL